MVRQVDGGAVRGVGAGRNRNVLCQDDGTVGAVPRKIDKDYHRAYYLRNRERLLEIKRVWREKNRERLQEKWRNNAAEWRKKYPDYVRTSMLRYKYGLTPEAFKSMLLKQNGRCAICSTNDPGGKQIWSVDHCHGTGRVRGLLCFACNFMLGHSKDNPSILRRAAKYLEAQS